VTGLVGGANDPPHEGPVASGCVLGDGGDESLADTLAAGLGVDEEIAKIDALGGVGGFVGVVKESVANQSAAVLGNKQGKLRLRTERVLYEAFLIEGRSVVVVLGDEGFCKIYQLLCVGPAGGAEDPGCSTFHGTDHIACPSWR